MNDQCNKLREYMAKEANLHKKDSPEQVNMDIEKGICAWEGCRNKRSAGDDLCWIHK